MSKLVLELPPEQRERLHALAAAQRRSEEEICLEALDRFLATQLGADRDSTDDGDEALLEIIGLVKDGPEDASVYHDIRPGEPY
jgi:hypothetical protein